ncbi:ornithine cyclodeaminase family protein [Microlunatus antarcticus]|uniref:Ornithine cyclodeaminase/alanine dehydrogenase n=1 Tax=Microlunatus antarcticus TaxID=53388 RepID=A0A7W5P837_9ACTN|nr:ornithine cyclodeaminase family protein [Microlunatus antarcticus]MBB3328204.1 ornithine cyclodeaminase/alanine dehydrogenase [Microlunatus antarcticus]
MTLFLSREDLTGLLSTAEVVRAVEEIHLDLGLGTMTQGPPALLASGVGDAVLLPMAALSDRLGLAVVKLMCDIPENRERGLPPQRSTLLVSSTVTGECVAVLDGAVLTRQRTAAASAVATAHLARADSRTLGLVGAGALAVEHVRALTEVRAFERVVVWTRSEQTLVDFALACDELGLDLPLTRATSAYDVVAQSDVVCTLTPSRTPVVEGRWFRAGQHINAVGAPPRPTHREIDAEGIARSELFVDSASTSMAKSGEILLAIAEGALPPHPGLRELGAVVAGRDPGRVDPDAITLFNSVGIGAQDLAVAALAIDRARLTGVGTDLPMTAPQLQDAGQQPG